MPIYGPEHVLKSYINVCDSFANYSKLSTPTRTMQTMHELTFEDTCESKIYQLLLSYLLKAEAISPGGFEAFVSYIQKDIHESNYQVFHKDSLDKLLSTFTDEDDELLYECFNIVGLTGKIVLSQHPINGDKNLIEVNRGCLFPDLMPAFELKSTKFLNPKIICIDGFIENVSEIHRILEDTTASKETIILFLRGLAEEVTRTLKVNYERGSLQVIPVIVKYDLSDVNTLVDLAIASNSDIVSSLKGNLITNIDISKYDRVDSVDITAAGVLVENNKTTIKIDGHIKKLQEKLLLSNNQYEKDAVTRRIQNLGTNRITIRLIDCKSKKDRSLKIDRALRSIKSSMSYGICAWNNRLFPYAGIKAGYFFATRFETLVENLGAMVIDN